MVGTVVRKKHAVKPDDLGSTTERLDPHRLVGSCVLQFASSWTLVPDSLQGIPFS